PWITSVCTGTLILAEAGLLDGYRATTHWGWLDELRTYSAVEVVDERVAVDRNRLTGGGVTAGIDFALTLIARVLGDEAAQAMQLVFEYRPQPPFEAGSPASAPAAVVAQVSALVNARKAAMVDYLAARNAA
ncbi:MAG: DJ-1/PfpI family protein, partial [Gammaproteobacteria bacterium]